MSEQGREFSGRSVDEAVAAGLQALGLRSNQVQMEVINKGSRGLFGIGSEPAVVRLTPIQTVNDVPTANAVPTTTQTASAPPTASAPSNLPQHEETPVTTKSEPEQPSTPISAVTETDIIPEAVVESDDDAEGELSDEESASPEEQEAETEAASVEMLAHMIGLLGFKVTVEPVWKDSDDEHDKRVLWLEIHGRNLSTLIGRRGDTLENIQYLLRMMVNQRLHRWNDIVVDVDQYRIRRAEQISQLANRLAEQALSAGRAMALEPMPPNERRIVHMALRNHPNVYTQSSGDGERRKVYIVPKS